MRRALRLSFLPIVLCTACWSGTVACADASAPEPAPRAFKANDRTESAGRANVLVLGAKALFGSNATVLTPAGEAALERLVERLADHGVSSDSVVAIRIVGHADGFGPAAYNRELSEHRAAAVSDAVARHLPGVPLLVEGRGESSPVASDATAEGRALNRRVEIHVLSTVEAVPSRFSPDGARSSDGWSAERMP